MPGLRKTPLNNGVAILSENVTFQSETAPLKRVVVRHARDAFINTRRVEQQWENLGYRSAPNYERALAEYDSFVQCLASAGAELVFAGAGKDLTLDCMYVRDASVVCDRGAILCSMGKPARAGEPADLAGAYDSLGVPVLGSIQGEGKLEGGDFVWLAPRVAAVGEGYRSNAQGIAQLRELLGESIDELITVPLPHWRGPSDVFHLMSMISPLDHDLALVYSPLMPVPFRNRLLDMGIALVEVPNAEFADIACNVVAISPRKVVMVAGNPRTRERLEEAGVTVLQYPGLEISAKGEGGPTCLTRPLERERPGTA
jgi:N-dimethylarginine dimethylaminohydrolase